MEEERKNDGENSQIGKGMEYFDKEGSKGKKR